VDDNKYTRITTSGTRTHYLGDGVGTLSVTINDSGTVLANSQKDVFGYKQISGGITTERYGFAQRESDTESGLVQMRNRLYDARTGRFTQTDPILGNRPSKHYGYAGNNPVSTVDPWGLQEVDFSKTEPGARTRFIQEDHTARILAEDREPLSARGPGIYVVQKPGAESETSEALPPVHLTNADLEKFAKNLGWRITEINGQRYFHAPGGWLGVTTPQGQAQLSAHYGEAAELTLGINLKHPTALQVGLFAATLIGGVVLKELSFAAEASSELGSAESAAARGMWKAANETMSIRSAAYQARITGRSVVESYVVKGVKFDGFKNGILLEAKGPGYASFVRNGEFRNWFKGAENMVDQARRQVRVAGGTPIHWHVAEENAAKAIRELLRDNEITGIDIIHTP